jgi:hypothetical protein
MPRLTVRSMAEMLTLPAYEQLRILHDQKYPKQQPQVFRAPYYAPALTGIREFHRLNNSPASIENAKIALNGISLATRRANNRRVLDSFESSNQFTRQLLPKSNSRMELALGSVQLKLSTDLRADDGKGERFIYYNCRAAALNPEIAKLTLEIAHWVLEENGIDIAPQNVEYIDLAQGKIYRGSKRRPTTLKRVKSNVKIIDTLWPTV